MVDFEKRWGSTAGKTGGLTFRPAFLAFGHDLRSQTVAPPFFDAAERENTPAVSRWSGRDLRFTPSLEYAIDLPDLGPLREVSLVAGVQTEYNVATDYKMTQCHLDRERQFIPSPYAGADMTDLYCVDGLMLREGTTVDSYGVVTQATSPRFGDGDELRVGTFFQLTSSLPRDLGVVLGGRLDYNTTYKLQFSPRVALVAPLGAGFYAKSQVSSAFVYPAFLYRTGNSLSDYQGNPEIQPQSIRTLEALLGWKGETVRTELSGYYNDVSRFITFDLTNNARSGQFLFSNQGDLKIVGLEATGLLRFLNSRLLIDLQGTYARPLGGTSERFVVDGELGGPSKYPQLLGRAALSVLPLAELAAGRRRQRRARPSGRASPARCSSRASRPRDGVTYRTRAAADFDTRDLSFNASAAYTLGQLRLEISGSNLLNRRAYRPGSVLVPYLGEGRRLIFGVSYSY